MRSDWKTLAVVLLGLTGAPCSQAWVQITWTGVVTAGVRTTFTCSSSCFSNCTYSWFIEGRKISGNTLTWAPDGLKDTLEITCTVFNPKTGVLTSTAAIADIKNSLSVRISPPGALPSLNQSLRMFCHDDASGDPSGGADRLKTVVTWYKDGGRLTLHDHLRLLKNNLTLHFTSLLPADAGFYQCEVSAPQGRAVGRGYLLSFDRWSISIAGPDAVFPGRLTSFTCIASCTVNVDCTVRWPFRGGFPLGSFLSISGNTLSWTPSLPGTFQNLTCVAENGAAGRSAEATKMVEVKGVALSGSVPVQPSQLMVALVSLRLLLLLSM